jgi:hypothetical protein
VDVLVVDDRGLERLAVAGVVENLVEDRLEVRGGEDPVEQPVEADRVVDDLQARAHASEAGVMGQQDVLEAERPGGRQDPAGHSRIRLGRQDPALAARSGTRSPRAHAK